MSPLLPVECYLNQTLPQQPGPASQELPPSPAPNNELDNGPEIAATFPFMSDAISYDDPLSNASILQIDAASVAQCFDPLGIDLLSTSKATASSVTPAFRGTESDHISPEIQPFQLPSASHRVTACTSAPPSDNAMIDALLRGLGLPDLPVSSTPVEFAEAIGSMLRASTAGTMDIFKVHAITRHQGRLKMPMQDDRANKLTTNPLHFFRHSSAALTHLLSHLEADPKTGHLQSTQAYINAFNELNAQEIATMSGLSAALAGVLKRVDPALIEQQMPKPTVMDKLFAHRRKARMWDGLVELYSKMKTNADDDFQRQFGEKFNQIYQAQIQRTDTDRK